jgi:Fic-DOC domain mobile mystery protein B
VQPTVDGGTLLDPDEEADLIPGHLETHADLNEWEQANILRAVVWLQGRPWGDSVLSLAFLRELHRRMFDQTWRWAGTFRTTERNLGDAPFAIQDNLKNLLEDTRHWIDNQTYGEDELAARFHHRLVKIHPFSNGNGRHGRLMTQVPPTRGATAS